ncbi:MAG TPA: adenylate/guanylate cyclase domain-containing protein [Methylomirabilota bacterium]|nr:adenylate/guanylate cyclase domain-containing protein [Methylomirabilota bacterium]
MKPPRLKLPRLTLSGLRRQPRKLGPWWRNHRRRLLQFWAVGVASSVVVTAASAAGYLEGTQAKTLDLLLRLRGSELNADVVIVAIDDEAFDSVGQLQPLPREYLAKIIRGLQRAGAAVVGLDVTFQAPTTHAADAAFARAVRDFSDDGLSRVVLTSGVMPKTGPLADGALLAAVVRGAPDVPEDPDAMIRRTTLLLPGPGGRFEPSFALAVVARLGGLPQRTLDEALGGGLGTLALPEFRRGHGLDPRGEPLTIRADELLRINFIGKMKSFLTIPSNAVAALADPRAEIAPDNPFRGRVVFVGATFQESRDFFTTPHGAMAGVEVHANVAHMLLTRSFIRPSGWVVSFLLQVVVVMFTGAVLVSYPPMVGTLVSVGGMLLVGFPASYVIFHRGSYWVDFMLPILATRFLGFGADTLERRRFKQAFSRYVSREVAAQVLSESPGLRGERREVSILFSDLRGFTTMSEDMPPEQVAAILNEYFDAMTAAIFRYRGMINDFVGDAVMAIFGAPLQDREHALHATRAGIAMGEALEALNLRWKREGLPQLRMGIGIHSGEVFAGNIGGRSRVKYTLIGDAVNVASRVEGLNKELGTTMLITEATRRLLGDGVKARDMGPREVKGRTELVHVHELLALVGGG